MAVLWGVVFADDEMGGVRGEVVLVDAAELLDSVGYIGLGGRRLSVEAQAAVESTNPLLWRDARAADDNALEGLGSIDAKFGLGGRRRSHFQTPASRACKKRRSRACVSGPSCRIEAGPAWRGRVEQRVCHF